MATTRNGIQVQMLVLGGGIVGLNTALRLQKDFPQAVVTIMATDWGVNTVSGVAAGFFRATPSIRGPTPGIAQQWTRESWAHYQHLKVTESPRDTGIIDVPTYVIASLDVPLPDTQAMEELCPLVRQCTKQELDLFAPKGRYVAGRYFQSLTITPEYYMPWAMNQFKSKGGIFVHQKISSWSDLQACGFDLVINCTGMGAQKLCHDSNMSPVRGQVIRVKAPWQKFCVFADNDTYVIPGMDSVTLGGCRQFGNHQPNIDEDDQKAIWRRVTRLMPNLKKAQFVADGVGLRPHRTSIRVEKEMMTLSNGSILHVVHHYGHCGYGWIVSPGSAITASQLAREILQSVEPREGGN